MDNRTLSFVAAFVVTGLCAPVSAQMKPADLAQASLEDLMRIEITAAGRKEQRADSVAAAAFVTADDIRRSGLRTLPDLMRLVPGVQVAQVNSSRWAVSVRGFNNLYANKLLVQLETYIGDHSDAEFSHGICPTCLERVQKEFDA